MYLLVVLSCAHLNTSQGESEELHPQKGLYFPLLHFNDFLKCNYFVTNYKNYKKQSKIQIHESNIIYIPAHTSAENKRGMMHGALWVKLNDVSPM